MATKLTKRQKKLKKQRTTARKFSALSSEHSDSPQKAHSGDKFFIYNPKNMPKLSAHLLELIEPWINDFDSDPKEFEKLVTLGITAWNMCLVSPESVTELTLQLEETFSSVQEKKRFYEFLEKLKQRKQNLFPDDSRLIIDFTVSYDDDEFHLEVISPLFE